MDDFRESLMALLLKYGFESATQWPNDDELLGLVVQVCETLSDFESAEKVGKTEG